MSRINFAEKKIIFDTSKHSYEEWKKKFKEETGKPVEDFIWETMDTT